MDPRQNPYTPNAGARPAVLVGRDELLTDFEVLLDRLRNGYTEQSMIITGLRGVGKTVLLGEFEGRAATGGWVSQEAEITKNEPFGERMALLARRALFRVAPKERWGERTRRAAAIVKSFQLTIDPEGKIGAGLDFDAEPGSADSGRLSDDLTDLFVALGEAAQDHATGVAFLLDEVQFLDAVELEALIAAMHKTVQKSLPITLVGAGLPQLPRLAGEAKSYAERLFKFPLIGQLSLDSEAPQALTKPASDLGVEYTDDAVKAIVDYTEGYPYFIQEYGKIVWNQAPEGAPIGIAVVEEAQALVEEKLDASFFRVRTDRTSELELQYLRAMAELGPGPHRTGEIAEMMTRTSEQIAPTRARLIEKGLVYTPGYGLTAFTVPQFDRYMRRHHALAVPAVKRGRRKPSGS